MIQFEPKILIAGINAYEDAQRLAKQFQQAYEKAYWEINKKEGKKHERRKGKKGRDRKGTGRDNRRSNEGKRENS